MRLKNKFWIIPLFILTGGCLEPFNPSVIENDMNFLVFEGITVNDANESVVKLTRSQKLNDKSKLTVEKKAKVTIQTIPDNTFTLDEKGNGVYSALNIDWNSYQQCKVKIETSDGAVYESKYTDVKKSPEIDSISWKADGEGLHIFANTHDNSNNTWYYRWDYIETCEYRSAFDSPYEWDSVMDRVFPRPNSDQIFHCWSTFNNTRILIGTSQDLNKDIIKQHELALIPPESWKHEVEYSILVKQFALSKDAYDYIYNIQKSNEEIGSLFDPQPVNVKGNIACTSDPTKEIIGFFTISSTTQKRMFVKASQLPQEWNGRIQSSFAGCVSAGIDTLVPEALTDSIMLENLIVGFLEGPVPSYLLYGSYCVDCRFRNNGTNKQPDFWE